jgi:HKD family nuclease
MMMDGDEIALSIAFIKPGGSDSFIHDVLAPA